MTDERIKLIIGSLLHDVGKIIYRTSDRRTHAESGYHFLKEETNIEDKSGKISSCKRVKSCPSAGRLPCLYYLHCR